YVGQVQETQVGAGSSFGAPSAYYYAYYGPEINTDPTKPLLTREQAIQAVFNYYGITAPNQFPTKNGDTLFGASVPGVNTKINGSLKSPSTDEFSVGIAGNLSTRGNFRVDGVYRKAGRFYSLRTDKSTGQVTDELGNTFDLGLVENVDEPLERKYWGMNLQLAYRPVTGLNVGANWTWSHTYGNFIGETSGSGPVQSTVLQYPEFKQTSWNNPNGDLSQDQRHKVRVYATYDLPMPKAIGVVTLSALHQYDGGTPYGALGTVRYCTTAGAACNWVANPGYATPPAGSSSPNYYYTARDAYRTDNINRTDIALNYAKSIGPVEVFVRPDVLNVFNNQGVLTVNSAVSSRTNGGANFTDFNPFTTANPIECPQGTPTATCKTMGANWQKGSNFGKPTAPSSYQLARTFRITFGARF
ncbi:MAG TPA: hypothetical protein VGR00_02945, partial [Thermoanaerobaculia bacterium]|nr:hypothetical protein [Thermoanaerobaculia bacterium]